MTILIPQRAKYPAKSLASFAKKAWSKFFETATEGFDIARWLIQPDSGCVRVSGRISTIHDCDPKWEFPEPIYVSVDGICELLNSHPVESWDQLKQAFQEWAQRGIVEAFQSPAIQKKYQRFNATGRSFVVVSAPWEEALEDDDLTLLWSNDKRLSVSEIRRRQATARKKLPKRRTVKKRAMRKGRPQKNGTKR